MNKKTFIIALCMVGHGGYAAQKRELKAKHKEKMALTKQENVQMAEDEQFFFLENTGQEMKLVWNEKKMERVWDNVRTGEQAMQFINDRIEDYNVIENCKMAKKNRDIRGQQM